MDAIWLKIAPTLAVALGGGIGASLRFWVRELTPAITGTAFPFSTLLVNVTGCFLSGMVYMWLETSGGHWSSDKILFFFVGLLGAFTTFSAFALDSFLLFEEQQLVKFGVNILANCVLCLISVFAGAMLGVRIAA